MKETFADRLKAAMEQRGLKQVDLIREAEQAGVKLGKSHMSQYVSGKTIPRSGVLHFLAKTLQVSPAWLEGREEPADHLSASDIYQNDKSESSGGRAMRTFKNQANWTMYYTT